jgi:hypothetical protein
VLAGATPTSSSLQTGTSKLNFARIPLHRPHQRARRSMTARCDTTYVAVNHYWDFLGDSARLRRVHQFADFTTNWVALAFQLLRFDSGMSGFSPLKEFDFEM